MLKLLWQQREKPPVLTRPWFKNWAKRAWTLPSLLLAASRVNRLRARGARIGAGTIIAPAHIRGARWLSIGENSFIGRVHMQAQAKIQIGSHVCINDGVRLMTASHDVRASAWTATAAAIVIEDFAWIATGATVLPGVRIGRGALVGACAVVARGVPDFAVAVGNPAQIRERVRAEGLDYSPVRFLAAYNAWLGSPNSKVPPA